ncbi:hypothetical protein [Treponema pectinovorum]|uniref:hypothetical protein n=1 Tax=Treponema pectinovorum TaxID=164 RepID=UPI003D91E557
MAVGEFEKGNFLSSYIFERGLLNVSKSEYGKIVFYELAFIKNVCVFFGEFSTSFISLIQLYSIAEKLKIKPSKVASLLKDIFYSGFEKTENNSSSSIEIICKYISKDRFEKEKLSILIANPVEQEIVERFLLENNARYDTSELCRQQFKLWRKKN